MKPFTCLLSIVFMLGSSACHNENIGNTAPTINTIEIKDKGTNR